MIATDSNGSFFESYFSPTRFGIESFLAVFAVTLNGLALTLLCRTCHVSLGKSVYRIQYANLTVINAISCAFSWIFNNLLYLFQDAILRQIFFNSSGLCRVLILMVGGSFVSSAFGILNTLSMLGFATTQYFAVCKPLENMNLIRRKRVFMFVISIWIFSLLQLLKLA